MRKRFDVIAIILCMALCVCACASGDTQEHKTDAEKKIESAEKVEEREYQRKLDAIDPAAYGNISGLNLEKGTGFSVIGKGADGQYWEQVKKGAEQAVADINEELGYEGKEEVKVTYSGPADAGNVDEQVNILDEELARYPVGLSISIADEQACKVQFDLAASNGIPIVAFDSASDYKGLMATVSTDNKGTAQMAADKTAEFMENSGEVLVVIQDSKSMSAKQRETGFVEKIQSDYPEISVVEVYHMDQLEDMQKLIAAEKEIETPEEITEDEVMDYILEKYPNLKGCFAADGDAVKAVTGALGRSGREDVTVVGYDGNKDELEELENGEVDGLVIQNPYGMGYAAVVASARAALSMGNEAYINTGAMWVTKENLDSDEVKSWLY